MASDIFILLVSYAENAGNTDLFWLLGYTGKISEQVIYLDDLCATKD